MDGAELTYVILRLVLGAAAAFCSILVWSKTRDTACVLLVLGTIFSYIETVYYILAMFGMTAAPPSLAGGISAIAIFISSLPEAFYISAFLVMLAGKYGR
ncbi:MAG: hypothetical protein Ta2F_06050 [Termitinemataceae bacterium]|nr:MAG: hypothetical protein Ta2F_06050 [Termitinemataceae bacterium]